MNKRKKSKKQIKLKQILMLVSLTVITVVIAVLSITAGCDQKDIDVLNPDETTLPTEESPTTINSDNPKPTPPVHGEDPIVITADNYMDDPKGLLAGGEYGKQIFDEGAINILITGEDRNALTDTIGIISINKKDDKVKIVMIPRDMFVDYNDGIIDYLKKNNLYNEPGIFKINYSYYLGARLKHEGKFDKNRGISFLTDILEEKFDIKIQDFVKVNTEGFVKVIDLFGGVDINVPYHMQYEDPSQDLYIYIEEGQQHLDGKAAEGFVRHRQGYDLEGNWKEYGDIQRKRNQINLMKAFFEQHVTLSNVPKLPEFLALLGSHVKTSINAADVISKYIGIGYDVLNNNYAIEDLTLSGKDKVIKGSYYLVVE